MKKQIKVLGAVTDWRSESGLFGADHFSIAGLIEHGSGIAMVKVELHVYDPGLIDWLRSHLGRDIKESLQLTFKEAK